MSTLSLVLVAWVLAAVPDYPGQPAGKGVSLKTVAALPGVRAVLALVLCWMLAHNILYTYIAPFAARAGLASRVDVLLFIFGFAALLGIWMTGSVIDNALRISVLTSLSCFALTALALLVWGSHPIVLLVATAVWGLTFGGAATQIQTALADTAGTGADLALSMNVVVWNGAIAGGSILGGVLLHTSGPASFPPVILCLALLGLGIAHCARKNGFPAGRRLVAS